MILRTSQWSKYAQYGSRFSDLYSATLRDAGMLCLAIYRKIEDAEDDNEDVDSTEKVTLQANNNPNKKKKIEIKFIKTFEKLNLITNSGFCKC